jgi:putative DNA primase/helicase
MSLSHIVSSSPASSGCALRHKKHLAAIARQLGGALSPDNAFIRCHCPVHDDQNPSCSLWLDRHTGRVRAKCFAGCPERAVLAGLKVDDVFVDVLDIPVFQDVDLAQWYAESAGYDQHCREEAGRRSAERCFHTAAPVQPDDLVDRYLRRRGIALGQFQDALRLHPRLWHTESWQQLPAMVAKVSAPDGSLITTHRTWLNPETEEKASVEPVRKLCSTMRRGAAVRLFDTDGDQLLVGEGIETTLAALALAGWSLTGWATVSALGMARLDVPRRFRRVVIGADHDRTGLDAARALARRLGAGGRHTDIRQAPNWGEDWNDELLRRLAGRSAAA